MVKNKNLRRCFTALLLCVLTVAGTVLPSGQAFASSYQSEINAINQTLDRLKEEQQAIKDSIAGAKTQKAQEEQKRGYIDQEIKLTKDEITILLEKIDLMEQHIQDKKTDISGKEKEIEANYNVFLQRMRVMYMYDDTTTLGLLLGADSYARFLTNADNMARVAEHDRLLLQALSSQLLALEEAKSELDASLAGLEEDRSSYEEKNHTLNGQLQAANLRIQSLADMESEFLADLEKNQANQAAMQKELEDIYARIQWDQSAYVGGEMAWPVPNFTRISSEYGWRFNNKDFHTGIDIAGPSASGQGIYGAQVACANGGTVKYTNWTYSPGSGYGIYIIVDHGGGVSTLYGHLSNILVKVGDSVSRGQPIGEVGSTGWSTGPHLHFEVRVNGGTHTNPRPYIFR
jgi:murein DD-endopeptidase MepM/ murein hydrolase activator NlpD